MRTFKWLVPGYLLLLTGCMHIDRPAVPQVIGPSNKTTYSADLYSQDYTDYKADVKNNKLTEAKFLRDKMINGIEAEIEQNYRDFEGKLFTTRAGLQTGSDVVQLGLSAATGVVEGTEVKDLLAAALTGFKGASLSFDKNFFREKTTEALIAQMQAYRDTVRNRITQKMTTLDVSGYPFEEARRDLTEFFYAGTIPAALVQLANTSGKAATEAKAESERIDIKRANKPEEAKASVRIHNRFKQLAADINDPAKKDEALRIATNALKAVGQDDKVTSDMTPQQVIDLLKTEMANAADHPEDILPLDQALSAPAQ